MATKRPFTIIYILLIYLFVIIKCNLEEIKVIDRRLDDLLVNVDSSRLSNSFGLNDKLFPFYNLELDDENHEELIVTNVSSRIDPLLFKTVDNLEFFSDGKNFYLAGSIQSMIFINIMDENISRIVDQYQIKSQEKILTFKIFSPSTEILFDSSLIIVVAFEVDYRSELRWYKFNRNKLEQFWRWPIDRQVKKLEYFQHEIKNRFILLKDATNNHFQVDIYDFEITKNSAEFRLLQSFLTSEIINFKVCPTFEGTQIISQGLDSISVYNYRTVTLMEESFELMQEIKLTNVRNSICFHTRHIFYLATVGSNSSILEYFDNKFQIDSTSTTILENAGEIYWIESIPLDTYRDDVLLLIQLKNSSIFIVLWQSHGFEKILQPFFTPDPIDLSKIIVIPKLGFIYENKIIKIETQLRESPLPNYEEMKRSVDTFNKLMEIFQKQEIVLEETVRRIEEDYMKNPFLNGIWNISESNVVADIITKMNGNVECKTVSTGAINLTCLEFNSSHNELTSSLELINTKLNEINLNMNNAIAINATDILSYNNIEVVGDLKIRGTISLKNLTFNAINNISVNNIHKNSSYYSGVIEGEKFFPLIDVEKLKLHSINGIPVTQIVFDTEFIDYEGINFPNITKLEVDGDLNFLHLNNIHWESLMKSVIRKSEEAIISEELIVHGTINAKYANVNYLNNLKYPDEYVQKNSRDSVIMRGDKTFNQLQVGDLNHIKTINKIPMNDFILLRGDTTLKKEITFHNLTVVGLLEINGEIKDYKRQTMNSFIPTESVYHTHADIIIKKLRVRGNIQVIESFNNKTWREFNDLVNFSDDLVEITGKKTFLGRVEIGPGLSITSRKINGHLINEFMTLDTSQVMPNLEKIDGNVTIDRLIESDVIQLERLLFENQLNKKLIFKVPPIVDKVSAKFINGYIPDYLFALKLNESFSNVVIEDISVKNLHANEINPQLVNGLNYKEIVLRKGDRYGEQNLQTRLDNLYEKILNGSVSINNLTVTGSIKTKILNGISLLNIYNVSNMGSVIFENNVHIENLTIHGLINGINFSEIVADAILKTDENIIITGNKKFNAIICESLELSTWNDRSINDILDSSKHQILSGPIIVKGHVIVEKYFDPVGTIGGINFADIENSINYHKNNTYSFNGNFQFTTNNTVDINHLIITDNIQDTNFNNFIESIVFLDSNNVTITGAKTFENFVSVHNFTIVKQFNDIDLEKYFRDVIRIDNPVSIKSDVIFQNNLTISGDLVIKNNLMAKTIMGIDFEELLANAMYTNEPTIVTGTLKFNNLTFLSDIDVEKINDINMDNLITLNKDQIIPAILHCQRITVDKLNVVGKLNGYEWSAIFNETFLLIADQNITGNISFMGDVIVEDFDSKFINNIDPNKWISTYDDEIIVGNFLFNSSIVMNGNLRINGYLNNIDLLKWKNAVLTHGSSLDNNNNDNPQIISSDWIVRGNVQFHGDISGNDYLNGTNVKQLNNEIGARASEINQIIRTEKNKLEKLCKDLKYIKKVAERKIYKFKYFEYLQIMKFDEPIVSSHFFDYNNLDYLFVNFANCQLECFIFNNNNVEFTHVITIANFGYINRWISFKFRGIIYILTLGEPTCNRSSGNFWKLINNELILVIDFGYATDAKKISNNNFLIIINSTINYYSLEDIYQNSTVSSNSWTFANKNIKLLPNSAKSLIIDDYSFYELKNDQIKFSSSDNLFKTNKVTSFHVGIFQREIFVYYDKKICENYIFISNNNQPPNHIVQTIDVNRPVSIRIINFDNYIENFLVFIESGDKIQIYEYKGIEGFVYRETIRIKAEKLYTFKLRKHRKFVKINCLALINKNRLIILEAKMYGEKLATDNFSCAN